MTMIRPFIAAAFACLSVLPDDEQIPAPPRAPSPPRLNIVIAPPQAPEPPDPVPPQAPELPPPPPSPVPPVVIWPDASFAVDFDFDFAALPDFAELARLS